MNLGSCSLCPVGALTARPPLEPGLVLLCKTQTGAAVWCESSQLGVGRLPKAGLCRAVLAITSGM